MANYRNVARQAARRYGLDPNVFVRQIQQESGFNAGARNPKSGATGIAQIMPATARGWGVDPTDPVASLNAAAKNMASYVKQYGGYENALRAYNAGPGAIQKSKGYAETNAYVKTILGGRTPSTSGVRSGAGGGRGGGAGGGGSSAQTTTTTSTTASTPDQLLATALMKTRQSSVPTLSAPALPERLTPQGYRPVITNQPEDTSDLQQRIAAVQKTPEETTTTTSTTSGGGGGGGSSSGGAVGSGPALKGSQIKELIFNDGGKGDAIKNGQAVDGRSFYSAVWAGHADHVHVAAGQKTVRALGKVARDRYRLHVGENPAFGGVSGGHVPGSYHFKGEAIDVSGDAKKMKAFARYIERYAKSR